MLHLLAVHDSDQVHNIYAADSIEEMIEELQDSPWWEDIVSRLEEDEIEETNITIDDITSLYHDGDSVVGYTLDPNSKEDNKEYEEEQYDIL